MILFNVLLLSASALASTAIDSFKNQYCTDPRTMRKHAAYTEWADAYSCTRHRCQPGGRNLAIYTVGCKRVEAPESAIECEEVVEDTNMQFPFCCTRLRCLVVVRGEVWTRVLGQPWETLPAAPWSHMYKMKKPPPADGSFPPKRPNDGKRTDPSINAKIWDDTAGHPNDPGAMKIGEGPIYELTSDGEDTSHNKVLRSSKKPAPTEAPDCNEVVPRAAAPSPDIVIALSTNEGKERKKNDGGHISGHKRKTSKSSNMFPEEIEGHNEPDLAEGDESIGATEKLPPFGSEEQIYANSFGVTQKVPFKAQTIAQPAWTEEPQSPGNEPSIENRDPALTDFGTQEPEKREKPSNLQALVDAIGTRMRDIESVVQRMSEKVHQSKPGEPEGGSAEKNQQRSHSDGESTGVDHKEDKDQARKGKRPAHDEHYKRFSVKNHGSKYLHASESTTDLPLYIEDTNMNGYFSDASNTVLRRASQSKEPAATYMAPVDTRRKSHINPEGSGEEESKKHKKHTHKKKRSKGRGHKKHRGKDDKRKKFNKISSVELDKNAVSLDDSSVM